MYVHGYKHDRMYMITRRELGIKFNSSLELFPGNLVDTLRKVQFSPTRDWRYRTPESSRVASGISTAAMVVLVTLPTQPPLLHNLWKMILNNGASHHIKKIIYMNRKSCILTFTITSICVFQIIRYKHFYFHDGYYHFSF